MYGDMYGSSEQSRAATVAAPPVLLKLVAKWPCGLASARPSPLAVLGRRAVERVADYRGSFALFPPIYLALFAIRWAARGYTLQECQQDCLSRGSSTCMAECTGAAARASQHLQWTPPSNP